MSERPNTHVSYVDLQSVGWEIVFVAARDSDKFIVTGCSCNGRTRGLEVLEDTLEALGLDLKHYNYKVDRKLHRPLTAKTEVVNNYRFVAPERVDQDWLESGYATEEVKGYSSAMGDMQDTLNDMSGGGSWN